MAPLYLLFEFSVLLARLFGAPSGEGDEDAGVGEPPAPATG